MIKDQKQNIPQVQISDALMHCIVMKLSSDFAASCNVLTGKQKFSDTISMDSTKPIILKVGFSNQVLDYLESSIRSRLSVILDPNFPRLLLEVIQKLCILEQNIFL